MQSNPRFYFDLLIIASFIERDSSGDKSHKKDTKAVEYLGIKPVYVPDAFADFLHAGVSL